MDTRLRSMLHDLASEMPVGLERSARPTLRRARRRRAVGAAGAVVAVVAFVAVAVSAMRLVSDPTVPATTGPNPATGPNLTDVPPDVAATAQSIYDAAAAKDFDALAELLDPNTFIYNLGDASDPIPEWRSNPSELDLMVAILEMPPTTRDIGPGYGIFTFWPYLVNSDFGNLSPAERADLAALGYSDEEIQLMIDGGTGYQGPRLAIDENGEWRNFITVGE